MEYKILCIIGEEIEFNIAGKSKSVNIFDLKNPENLNRIYRIQFSKEPKKEYFEIVVSLLKENPQIELRFYGNYSENLIDWKSLIFVERLQIDLWETKNLNELSQLVNLKRLAITKNVKSTVSLKILKDLKNLEVLFTSISKDIEIIGELQQLKFLSLREIKTENVNFLKTLKNLNELWISLGSYENIHGIQFIENLNKLSIHQIRGIDNENLNNVISKCQSLTAIELQNLKNLNSLDFVEKLQSLNYLRLDTIKNIETYNPILKSKSLKTISTTSSRPIDRNINYLKNIETLFLGDSYSKIEIEEFIKAFKGETLWIWGKELKGKFNIKNPFKLKN
jgi:hypothetical protein